MESKYQVEYLPIAAKDLEEIFEYIQSDNPSTALNLLNEMDATISKLETFPFMGTIPKDPRLQYLNYRMLVIQSYLIFYVVLEDVVEIRRILHGKRKFSFLL